MGPTGPSGAAGITQTNTYGRKYDTTENTITLEANISQDVPLGSNGPSNGITLGTQNKLTIPADGVYKVDYYFSGSSNVNADITLNVKNNITGETLGTLSTLDNKIKFIWLYQKNLQKLRLYKKVLCC